MTLRVNITIDLIALVIVILIGRNIKNEPVRRTVEYRLFDCLLTVTGLILVADMAAWLLGGVRIPFARTIHILMNLAYYILQIIYAYLWLLYTVYWVTWSGERLKKRHALYAIPMLLEIALLLLNLRTGWIYAVDANNVYARGAYFSLNNVFFFFYIICATGTALWGAFYGRDAEQKRNCRFIALFMALPIFATILEIRYYGLVLIWPFVALSLLMVYLNVQQRRLNEQRMAALRQAESTVKLENELMQGRIAIMLSQIQPHFLYNALCAIQDLCHGKAPEAEQATIAFSEFLRGNLDSLREHTPIPFEQELKHTQNYLALERLRFGDRLTVVYDIQETRFRIPTLTLQPIAENAVRYGLMKRVEGGTVTISTKRSENAYYVTVCDDGVGFDPEAEQHDGRTHVGLENVSSRLKSICGGSLAVHSVIGKGTTAVITIPMEEVL